MKTRGRDCRRPHWRLFKDTTFIAHPLGKRAPNWAMKKCPTDVPMSTALFMSPSTFSITNHKREPCSAKWLIQQPTVPRTALRASASSFRSPIGEYGGHGGPLTRPS
eukprot:1608444-Alexandrium_andersonii.AAC.1